jgi:hypothetical protein
VDASGAAVVGGVTNSSPDFPVTPGAYKTAYDWSTQAGQGFVTCFDPTGSTLRWSTFIGGSWIETGVKALALDAAGNVTVGGYSGSSDFPTTSGAWVPPVTGNPQGQAYLTRIKGDGSGLVWSSLFGGHGGEFLEGLALDASGGVVAAGWTDAKDFPTTLGAFQPQPGQYSDCFVVRLDPTGSMPIYSTYLASDGSDLALDVAVDASGMASVLGRPQVGFPLTSGAFQSTFSGTDVFVSRLNPHGTRLVYSTLLGGPSNDEPGGIALNSSGRVCVSGSTAGGFPVTPNAWDPTFNGGQYDGFVASFDLVLRGVRLFGASSRGCRGPIQLNALEAPISGSATFGFYVSGAAPNSNGWLVLGTEASSATTRLGVSVWLALDHAITRIPIQTDADGYVEVALPLTSAAKGSSISAQAFVQGTSACGGVGSWSATNALTLTVL